MKLPNKIKILGYTYKIIHKRDVELDNKGWVASCSPMEQVIKVTNHINEEQQLQSLCHELIHAIDFITSGDGGYSLSEQQTDRLATGLVSIILNNKGIYHGTTNTRTK